MVSEETDLARVSRLIVDLTGNDVSWASVVSKVSPSSVDSAMLV